MHGIHRFKKNCTTWNINQFSLLFNMITSEPVLETLLLVIWVNDKIITFDVNCRNKSNLSGALEQEDPPQWGYQVSQGSAVFLMDAERNSVASCPLTCPPTPDTKEVSSAPNTFVCYSVLPLHVALKTMLTIGFSAPVLLQGCRACWTESYV